MNLYRFRLKVDHWILEASETTPSGDYEDFLFQSLGRKRRSVSLPTVTDWSAPRHSLRICYRYFILYLECNSTSISSDYNNPFRTFSLDKAIKCLKGINFKLFYYLCKYYW